MSERRIVSLVPSLTESVCELGLRSQLVACTSYCVRPVGLARTANLIGGTKNPDLEAIVALRPTHILVNEEENKPEHIAALAARYSTLNTFPKSPREVPRLLRELGVFLECDGDRQAAVIEVLLEQIQSLSKRQRFLYYIWRQPYMVAGRDTFISAMLELLGLENALPPGGQRYPELSVDQARALNPDLILLSSEPYPFRRRDRDRLSQEWLTTPPNMVKADGQLFSWYGARTRQALLSLDRWVKGEPQEMVTVFD